MPHLRRLIPQCLIRMCAWPEEGQKGKGSAFISPAPQLAPDRARPGRNKFMLVLVFLTCRRPSSLPPRRGAVVH